MLFYLLHVVGDVQPELVGPFPNAILRDREAIRLRMMHGDDDGLFKLLVNREGVPEVDSYMGMDFDVVHNWRDVEEEAEREGWTIFVRDTPNEHGEMFEIQRIDDPEHGHARLDSDVDALRLVRAEIVRSRRDSVHARAYRLLAELSPKTAYALLRGTFERRAP